MADDAEISQREEVLLGARNAVMGDRNQSYGEPTDSFRQIANFWNVYLFAKHGLPLNASDVALMLDLMKTSRLLTGGMDQQDTWMDKAGYAACGYEVADKKVVAEKKAKDA